jgi:predicted PurR-regulated permease PerM
MGAGGVLAGIAVAMNDVERPREGPPEGRPGSLLDVLIRAGLILALAVLCYQVFAPFLVLMTWAVILGVTLYPVHQALARRIGGRQGAAATVIALLGVLLIVAPTALLMSSVGDSVHQLVQDVQRGELQIPPPRPGVADWPVVGTPLHAAWEKAHSDLPALVQSLQPKIGELARAALAMVAGIGGAVLKFVAAFVVAAIVMAFGEGAEGATRAIFGRVVGAARGAAFTRLTVATIRAVAQGVIGVAFIQAIVVGLCLLLAGVPWAGVLALVVLVLGIAQVPALLVTLPAIAYVWVGGGHGNVEAAVYTLLLFVSGMADNVLKPLMLGRGVDAPMPVILLGALGGMATAGILGMFVGACLLALGYQVFMGWVRESARAEDAAPSAAETGLSETPPGPLPR